VVKQPILKAVPSGTVESIASTPWTLMDSGVRGAFVHGEPPDGNVNRKQIQLRCSRKDYVLSPFLKVEKLNLVVWTVYRVKTVDARETHQELFGFFLDGF